ncbi:hypothetical protein ACK37C_06580 [Aeromonas veronii]
MTDGMPLFFALTCNLHYQKIDSFKTFFGDGATKTVAPFFVPIGNVRLIFDGVFGGIIQLLWFSIES